MYPKIVNVTTEEGFILIVDFDNDVTKKVDIFKIWNEQRFNMLMDESFFRTVKVDTGGYGISWNDEIDISEYELWDSGEVYNNH